MNQPHPSLSMDTGTVSAYLVIRADTKLNCPQAGTFINVLGCLQCKEDQQRNIAGWL